jgi:hypothetical protein
MSICTIGYTFLEANTHSNISWTGGRFPIFDIAMANFERQTFPNQHFKDFQLTLEFQTMEADEDVNKAAITALAKKGYDIRHSR